MGASAIFRPHQDHFAFLRILAALLVLYAHQHALTGQPEPSFFGVHSWGGLGVMMFFSISGFLVMKSWLIDPNPFRFALRRLLRIWPGFAVAILLSALILGPWVSVLSPSAYYHQALVWDYVIHNLVFDLRAALPIEFHGSTLPFAVNGSLWTLPLELKCYFALIMAAIIGMLMTHHGLLLCTIIVGLTYAGWDVRGEHIVQYLQLTIEQQYLLEFGLCFFAGSLLQFYISIWQRRWFALGILCLAIAWIAWQWQRPVLAALVVVPSFTIAFGTMAWPVLRRFDALGDISYGLYLYAFPVQQTVIWALGEHMHWWLSLFITVGCTIVCAGLSWHLVERPALRLKPTRQFGRITTAGSA